MKFGLIFYLSEKLLKVGMNTIRITLNANDHSVFAIDMKKIESTTHIKNRLILLRNKLCLRKLPFLVQEL